MGIRRGELEGALAPRHPTPPPLLAGKIFDFLWENSMFLGVFWANSMSPPGLPGKKSADAHGHNACIEVSYNSTSVHNRSQTLFLPNFGNF